MLWLQQECRTHEQKDLHLNEPLYQGVDGTSCSRMPQQKSIDGPMSLMFVNQQMRGCAKRLPCWLKIAAFTACILVVKRNCIAGSSTLSTSGVPAETRLADDTKASSLRHLEDDDLSLALSDKKRKRNSQELSEKRIRGTEILP